MIIRGIQKVTLLDYPGKVALAAMMLSAVALPVQAAPETAALALDHKGHRTAFADWLKRNAGAAQDLEAEADALLRQVRWTPWPIQTASGVEYTLDANVNAAPALCHVLAAMVAGRFGANL